MKIQYKNQKIEKLCNQQAVAQQTFGKPVAIKLQTRIAEIKAASRVTELIAGDPHPLKGNRLGQFSLSFSESERVVFKPNQDPIPRHEDSSIDWSQVINIIIVFIGDYHV
ncbi:MAG: hypothetical protein H7832_03310 [Magnetococcus sp. DMHC-6]